MQPTFYLAPIQGITDKIFRNTFPKYFQGFDFAVTPFISTSKKKKLKGAVSREFTPKNDNGIKTIPQIMGNDPEDFISVAEGLNEIGYDLINWNLGCPYPMVTKKGRGAGMLVFPEKIDAFLEKIFSQVKSQVSIKLRLGLNSPEEILQLIPIFNRYPLQEIIIHPRTGRQMYTGSVDLEAFEKCLSISKHKVVYNGDIVTKADFEMLSAKFKSVDRWMIGRGVLRNPFLIEEIRSKEIPPHKLKFKILYDFHNELYSEYSKILFGPAHIADRMKGFWTYLGSSFEASQRVIGKIQRTKNIKDYLSIVNPLFETEINK